MHGISDLLESNGGGGAWRPALRPRREFLTAGLSAAKVEAAKAVGAAAGTMDHFLEAVLGVNSEHRTELHRALVDEREAVKSNSATELE